MRLAALATIDLTDPNQQHNQLNLFESLKDDKQALQEACQPLCQDGAHNKHHVRIIMLASLCRSWNTVSDQNTGIRRSKKWKIPVFRSDFRKIFYYWGLRFFLKISVFRSPLFWSLITVFAHYFGNAPT